MSDTVEFGGFSIDTPIYHDTWVRGIYVVDGERVDGYGTIETTPWTRAAIDKYHRDRKSTRHRFARWLVFRCDVPRRIARWVGPISVPDRHTIVMDCYARQTEASDE